MKCTATAGFFDGAIYLRTVRLFIPCPVNRASLALALAHFWQGDETHAKVRVTGQTGKTLPYEVKAP